MRKLRENKFFLVIGSLLGTFFIIVGLGIFIGNLDKISGALTGILYLLAGLIIFPPFDFMLEKVFKWALPSWGNGLLFLIFVIIAEII